MLFFLLSCLSFLLLSKSLSVQPLSAWISKCTVNEMRSLTVWFWQELLRLLVYWLRYCNFVVRIWTMMSMKKKSVPKVENVEEAEELSLLDLPELVLEDILGRLSPAGLCNVAGVCSSMRGRCKNNHLWERHFKDKWGRVIGQGAFREWQWFIASRNDLGLSDIRKSKGFIRFLSCIWPLSWLKSKLEGGRKPRNSVSVDSIMSWYLSLDSGKFWFPAQVYNREHGHVGFMLSCYDAELSYDCDTDTFHARYPPHGRRTVVIEEGVEWERLRVPPVDTLARDLHVSDCLNDLRPGDHVEIQWRRNKEFPYGWWYGVVGHSDLCDRNEHHCHCHVNDTIMLEFNQYTVGSRWRRTEINRKDHREEGSEADGFYGGIRKLHNKEEISAWRRLWPKEILE